MTVLSADAPVSIVSNAAPPEPATDAGDVTGGIRYTRPGPLPLALRDRSPASRQAVVLRQHNSDFQVDEQLRLSDLDDGQHCYLQVARNGYSTPEIVQVLAQAMQVAASDIGYAGMKDKRAVTRQWFSLPAPMAGAEGDAEFQAKLRALPRATGAWHQAVSDESALAYAVTAVRRQPRKLRRGDHVGNRFSIRLVGARLDASLQSALERIGERGAPNFFGHQRFGNDGENVTRALAWLPDQRRSRRSFQRGLHLSVLRAQLFNQVLAHRLREDNWTLCLPGEASEDGMPTGPMWGRGKLASSDSAAEVEQRCLLPWWPVALALEHAGLKQQRRSLIAQPVDLSWRQEAGDGGESSAVWVEFTLAPGSFATSILRELVSFAGDLNGE